MIDKKKVRQHYSKLARQAKTQKSKQRRMQDHDGGCFSFVFILFGVIAIGTHYLIRVLT